MAMLNNQRVTEKNMWTKYLAPPKAHHVFVSSPFFCWTRFWAKHFGARSCPVIIGAASSNPDNLWVTGSWPTANGQLPTQDTPAGVC